ncbi:MAG: hypothetical protein KDD62_12315 [Bdellovibrionales bacterium]|nr:hypothetical protein [Bdellovibrionales bacterium]
MRDFDNRNEVTLHDIPSIVANEEYRRWEDFCARSANSTGSYSMRTEGDQPSLNVSLSELPDLIRQEQLRRAYENDRR